MNINQDPLSRRESTQPPTPQERAAMRATRERVRTDEVARQEVSERRIAQARQENKDRIEISLKARRRLEISTADKAEHQKQIERMRNLYKDGKLGTPERLRDAANKLLGAE
jgi:hypothetical protein